MSKIAIVYYESLKNHIILKKYLNDYKDLIEIVVSTSITPRKKGKINTTAFKNFFHSPFIYKLFIFFITYFFKYFLLFNKKRIKSLCKKNKIQYVKSTVFNKKLIDKYNLNKDLYIIFCGSDIIDNDTLNYFDHKVIGLHEGQLPYMRGSALYFWYFLTEEFKYAQSTIHFLMEKLDSGEKIISYSEKILIKDCTSVCDLWLKLIKGNKLQLVEITNLIANGKKIIPIHIDDNASKHKTYYYVFPNTLDFSKLKEKKINFMNKQDLKRLIKEI